MAARARAARKNDLSSLAPLFLFGGAAAVAALGLSRKSGAKTPAPPTPPPVIPANAIGQTGNPATIANYTATNGYPVADDDRAYEFMIKGAIGTGVRYYLFNLGNNSDSSDADNIVFENFGNNYLGIQLAGGIDLAPANIFDGAPHHVVFSYESPNWTLYIDGVSVGTFTTGGRATPSSGQVGILRVDGNVAVGSEWENLAIYRHPLTAAQVASHWNNRASQGAYVTAVVGDAPASFWQFNDQPGSDLAVDTMSNLNLGYSNATLGAQPLFAT